MATNGGHNHAVASIEACGVILPVEGSRDTFFQDMTPTPEIRSHKKHGTGCDNPSRGVSRLDVSDNVAWWATSGSTWYLRYVSRLSFNSCN